MNSERAEEFSRTPAGDCQSDQMPDRETAATHGPSNAAARPQATVLVRGETILDPKTEPGPNPNQPSRPSPTGKQKSPVKKVSEAKVNMQSQLPALDDDADVAVQKQQIVIRDGKADLAFTGKLLASAAASSTSKVQWHEYRVYETNGGKHVFSKVTRTVYEDDQDVHEAEVFDPAPTSVPSQLLRSARDLTRSKPLTWMDAATAFFGYDPLAKTLYRKLSGQFEEHIS